MALLLPEDLADYLHRTISAPAANIAIRVAEGWLSSATRLAVWPDPVPSDLFAWAVELAAIAWSNPEGLSTLAVGDVSRAWALARRSEILLAAGQSYPGSDGTPMFSFPPPQPYPFEFASR